MTSHDLTVCDTSGYPISNSTHGDTHPHTHTQTDKPWDKTNAINVNLWTPMPMYTADKAKCVIKPKVKSITLFLEALSVPYTQENQTEFWTYTEL